MPPGSDNINALCFSDSSCMLYQMISTPINELLDSPFTSFAGFRYLLPFLHRLRLLPSIQAEQQTDVYSGVWDIRDIEKQLYLEEAI